MKKHYYIITGTSRGIGEALAYRLLAPGNVLFCLSRTQNPRLSLKARALNCELIDIETDLNDWARIRDLMHQIFRKVDQDAAESITLINNAGTVHPIKRIGTTAKNEEIARAVTVNLVAPMLITDIFVAVTDSWEVKRQVLVMSTGAAKRPVDGWSAYCSSKAGLDMYMACLTEEQKDHKNPVRAVAFRPGVVNTVMQEEIRDTDPGDFKELDRFQDLHSQGELLDPEFVASKIEALVKTEDFGKNLHVYIHDMD